MLPGGRSISVSADLQICCSACTATTAFRHTLDYAAQRSQQLSLLVLFTCVMFAGSAPIVKTQWCSCCMRVVDCNERTSSYCIRND
jgi:hypothetical protein